VSELQHPEARSFERVADLYERTRPSYPAGAVDWIASRLGIARGTRVLDLGAGTGKLAREWVALGADVVAVEPGPEMLARLARAVPAARSVLGAAEDIPLADESVDAVTCGQSFHWFRAGEALDEIARVLRPGGGLALVWNARDPDDPFQAEVTRLLDPFVPSGRPPVGSSTSAVEADARFGVLERYETPFEDELDAQDLIDRVASISFVAAASHARRRELDNALRDVVAAAGGRVAFRYRTEAYVTFAV
jgi:ubiquinone/menaquinone biosynthesis C-methylase UbiE